MFDLAFTGACVDQRTEIVLHHLVEQRIFGLTAFVLDGSMIYRNLGRASNLIFAVTVLPAIFSASGSDQQAIFASLAVAGFAGGYVFPAVGTLQLVGATEQFNRDLRAKTTSAQSARDDNTRFWGLSFSLPRF